MGTGFVSSIKRITNSSTASGTVTKIIQGNIDITDKVSIVEGGDGRLGKFKEAPKLIRYPENVTGSPTWIKYEIFTFVPSSGGGGAGQLTKNISKECNVSIALSANVQHNIKEGQKWEQSAGGAVDKLAAGGKAISELGVVGAAKQLTSSAVSSATSKAKLTGSGVTGTAFVDKMALKYDGPEGRTFSTTHKFVAKSKEESTRIREIINIFRHASAPSVNGGVVAGTKASITQTSYKFPDLFKVTWMAKKKPDEWMPQYDTCYCKSIDVKYGDGSGVSFDGTGAPLIYEVTMEFEEMAFTTKESIRKGR
jgi:hypothetical protein